MVSSEMFHHELAGQSSSHPIISDLVATVNSAAQIVEGPQRDAALLTALRDCRRELEGAEAGAEAARIRLAEAKDTFNCAAELLSGGSPSSLWDSGGGPTAAKEEINSNTVKREGGLSLVIDQHFKRPKTNPLEFETVPPPIVIPTNLIHMPPTHIETAGALMSAEDVASHRENFYQKLLGIPSDAVANYTPGLNQANLRSKAQLLDGIHIVKHWDTGADGLDAAAFRSKHKTWYTKMKPLSHKLGRRTGIHLRTVEPHHSPGGEGEIVLCRYSKDGSKSTVYIDVTQLYNALYEVHCLEHGHLRGKDAVKGRMDDLYANVPDSQVKTFLETCPVCVERRRMHHDV
mmetsp:Transcript_27194/g.56643  ORF Transcript_27194/g.56643 Transcript_27194/m.56643 type:complete len:346 (+) Transcript_27194:46-1083(+)